MTIKQGQGKGWHGAYMQVGDSKEKLCEDFKDGYQQAHLLDFNPESVCVDIKLTTKTYAHENSWK